MENDRIFLIYMSMISLSAHPGNRHLPDRSLLRLYRALAKLAVEVFEEDT